MTLNKDSFTTLQSAEEWPDNWPVSACQFADESNDTIAQLQADISRLRAAMDHAAQIAVDWPDGNIIDSADVLAAIAATLEYVLDA